MRQQFQKDFARVPKHQIILHCTTEGLASQYDRLGIGEVRELPYPIDPRFHQPNRVLEQQGPIKITCAGGLRSEKGHNSLAQFIGELWDPILKMGRAKLQIQAPQRQFQNLLADIKIAHRDQKTSAPAVQDSITRIEHPLDGERYREMIQGTDVGVFLYDGDSYATRCSGVLAEMLAAGNTPVIVPAGCWLADQLSEPTFDYLDRVFDRLAPDLIVGLDESDRYHASPCPDTLSIADVSHTLAIPHTSRSAIVQFEYDTETEPETYLRILTEQFDRDGRGLGKYTAIVGQRNGCLPCSTIIPIDASASAIHVTWQNAYQSTRVMVNNVRVGFVPVDDGGESIPAGAVGLIAANKNQFPQLLSEMLDHYAHYRSTAMEFSRTWAERHMPANTLAAMLKRGEQRDVNDPVRRAA